MADRAIDRASAALWATALDYDNHAALRGGVVADLFGRTLSGSATRLATFAACPFKYFVRYTLSLKPRREFKLQPLDLGNFYPRCSRCLAQTFGC